MSCLISFKRFGCGLALAGAMLIAAPGDQVMAQTTWGGSSSPDELRYRLDLLDAELQDIRARLGGTVGSVAPRAGGGGDTAQLEGEIRRLTAQVEQMQNRLNQFMTNAERLFGDIEFRLTELEGGDSSQISTPTLSGGNSGGGFSGQQVASVAVAEQGDLDRAIRDVEQGRFDQAEDRLRRFLNEYSGSPLAGDAWYWLGESQFVRGIHVEAARSYLNGYNSQRGGPRAAHNLFKLGVTLGRLGQLREACSTLREVRNQYPNAPDGLVSKADREADQLTCG